MYLVSAQEMRQMDHLAIEELGIPPAVLMENAGAALAREIRRQYPDVRRVLVLAGAGNNGGDGFVAARWLANQGLAVTLCFLGKEKRMSEESALHLNVLRRMKEKVELVPAVPGSAVGLNEVRHYLEQAELVVDALFGVGLNRPIQGEMAEVISWLNASPAIVVAADIPSGVNADTGAVEGVAVQADVTVTFGCPKRGHYLFPGAELRGRLVVADISIPTWLAGHVGVKGRLLTTEQVSGWLPVRKIHSHKGTYGHVLVIGGSREMIGAPVFAASAALASGSGYVTLAVPDSILGQVSALEPAALFWPWPEAEGRFATERRLSALQEELANRRVTAVALGPGTGRLSIAREWLRDIFSLPVPLVVDADGLNMLSEHVDLLRLRRGWPTVLTPHPGEMARLCQTTVAEVERRRWELAARFAAEHRLCVVLKGTYTLIALPDGEVYLNQTGSPSLAKAGSGDVLTGMIASFLGQGLPLAKAVCSAVYLHGLAGEKAALPSPHSSKPQSIIAQIGAAFAELQGAQ